MLRMLRMRAYARMLRMLLLASMRVCYVCCGARMLRMLLASMLRMREGHTGMRTTSTTICDAYAARMRHVRCTYAARTLHVC